MTREKHILLNLDAKIHAIGFLALARWNTIGECGVEEKHKPLAQLKLGKLLCEDHTCRLS